MHRSSVRVCLETRAKNSSQDLKQQKECKLSDKNHNGNDALEYNLCYLPTFHGVKRGYELNWNLHLLITVCKVSLWGQSC